MVPTEHEHARDNGGNGHIWAAFLAAGIGSFVVGLVVLLNETGVFVSPTLYGPAGGVSGRTTIAVVVWLFVWLLLHARWKHQRLESRRLLLVTLVLIALGVLGTFPPFWAVF